MVKKTTSPLIVQVGDPLLRAIAKPVEIRDISTSAFKKTES